MGYEQSRPKKFSPRTCPSARSEIILFARSPLQKAAAAPESGLDLGRPFRSAPHANIYRTLFRDWQEFFPNSPKDLKKLAFSAFREIAPETGVGGGFDKARTGWPRIGQGQTAAPESAP
jgi:hypothetical protein